MYLRWTGTLRNIMTLGYEVRVYLEYFGFLLVVWESPWG